ncbi:MAG TPA: CcmD family protein [Coriobacteriia bacterium]|jgi:CcmD family protein
MDNLEVYRVVLNGAPYVIAAYALIWATLAVFVGLTFRRLTRLEQELAVVEDAVERRQKA